MTREIRYSTLERVERLHTRILELTGGDPGHLSKSSLEYLLEAVKSVGERLEGRKAIVRKAAYLLYNLVTPSIHQRQQENCFGACQALP